MRKLFTILIIICLCGCMSSLSEQEDLHAESPEAKAANEYMWNKLHLGEYDSIPHILHKLNDAYYEDPENIKVTAHLGFIHLWAFSERIRKPADKATANHVYLSNHFFKEAIQLNPEDARLHGFQAATEMCEGALSKNPALIASGYAKAVKAIKKWPQFNKFALSFVESLQHKDSPMFRQGLKYQWELLDDCSCEDLSRKKILGETDKLLSALINEVQHSSDPAIRRACWNSWIAPHNLEGFFLNLGDMLVKSGNLEAAVKIYEATRLSPTFEEWPYKHLVDERIAEVKENYEAFNQPLELMIKNKKQIFINSEISCVGCHQMSPEEFKKAGYQEPRPEIYFTKN